MNNPRCMTPPEVARYLRVGRDKVLGMIRTGILPAVNVAGESSTRPRYVIQPTDLELFIARRAAVAMPRSPRRRRRTQAIGKEWF